MTKRPPPQVLTYKAVVAAARRYYKRGRLTAQHPDPKQRSCVYALGDCRCPIGAAFTARTLTRAADLAWAPLDRLVTLRIVSGTDMDFAQMIVLQETHDEWAIAGRHPRATVSRRRKENAFRELIGLRALPIR